ncbi:MAG: hypothetical protein M1820_007796 [Bogoriella megaspora]|nr:MAG: hypothetical protein M1820_007796 [Bogoriella megaspora]
MRLLDAASVTHGEGLPNLIEFNSTTIPPYAILSHTWGENEIQCTDLKNADVRERASFWKIRCACTQALHDGYKFVWIDTCSIDKSSSAELSEAIQSMFQWYERAEICYTYLENAPIQIDTAAAELHFAQHRWFTRGWTLQELLAPREMVFLTDGPDFPTEAGSDWVELGTKKSLSGLIRSATGIDVKFLLKQRPIDSASIAKRMSWASHRETTRPEDMAYSLMGIFSVNMPLLYGEGSCKAFLRLQGEIMKQSDDQSIFAWYDPEALPGSRHGLLAASPSLFKNSGGISSNADRKHQTFSMTNQGLQIDLQLFQVWGNIFTAVVDCLGPFPAGDSSCFCVLLEQLGGRNFRRFAHVAANAPLKTWRRISGWNEIFVSQIVNEPFPRN